MRLLLVSANLNIQIKSSKPTISQIFSKFQNLLLRTISLAISVPDWANVINLDGWTSWISKKKKKFFFFPYVIDLRSLIKR
jgi:hypothetical protein